MKVVYCIAIMTCLCLLSTPLSRPSQRNGGLILSGLDTLEIPRDKGFDFVLQNACTSFTGNSCIRHFEFFFYDPPYSITVPVGYTVKMGKLNLDSIKNAPADSIFQKNQIGTVDNITPDSLSSRIGNVYLLKTAADPRPGYGYPLYTKIKIIKFIVVDSAQHQIKMVFLWAYNDAGSPDLHTSGLDTFHLDTPVVVPGDNSYAGNICHNVFLKQSVFKVVGDIFTIPEQLVGSRAYLSVYDLKGKKLGTVKLGNERSLNLKKYTNCDGVVIVKLEKYR